MTKQNAMGWIIGYFVIGFIIPVLFKYSLAYTLFHGIIGLVGAIGFLEATK